MSYLTCTAKEVIWAAGGQNDEVDLLCCHARHLERSLRGRGCMLTQRFALRHDMPPPARSERGITGNNVGLLRRTHRVRVKGPISLVWLKELQSILTDPVIHSRFPNHLAGRAQQLQVTLANHDAHCASDLSEHASCRTALMLAAQCMR